MNKRIEEELFPFYALDALTDEEKVEVEAYIATDPAARERLNALQETAEHLPLAAESVMPSPSVKANLMKRGAGRQPRPSAPGYPDCRPEASGGTAVSRQNFLVGSIPSKLCPACNGRNSRIGRHLPFYLGNLS